MACIYGFVLNKRIIHLFKRKGRINIKHKFKGCCLYGSALPQRRDRLIIIFLSCLYGSEPVTGPFGTIVGFLSCLFGSELTAEVTYLLDQFLSCLYGSEHDIKLNIPTVKISKLPVRQ